MKITNMFFLLSNLLVCNYTIECNNQITNQKVLLNAESFGFGPTAAIAQMFPYLRENIAHLSFIGTGHSLDLQAKLPYNSIYDYDAPDADTKKINFDAVVQNYDVFITALDFQAAQWAKEQGLKVIIYDPLTWYWPTVPSVIKDVDLYIAQNFFGVAERLKSQEFPKKSIIIPPIIKKTISQSTGNNALINVGGLFNPFMKNKDLINFAHLLFETINDNVSGEFDTIYYAANQTIARAIPNVPIKTLQPAQIQNILEHSKLVIMTPGLGNIYEAAMMKKYVIWLPPANDSQGQQLKVLRDNNMLDYALDWHQILDDEQPIDYYGPQQEVLKHISNRIQRISTDSKAQNKLKELIKEYVLSINSNLDKPPLLSKLIDTFGNDGAKIGCKAILETLHNFNSKNNEGICLS